MDKLYNYLIKLGVVEKTSENRRENFAIELRSVSYGDNYFYNAPNHFYNAYLISFDYNRETNPEYFKGLKEIEEKIKKYCKRYGYEIFNYYVHTWQVSFCIARPEKRRESDIFYHYRDLAIEEVNENIHLCALAHKPVDNNIIRQIMDKYGTEYNNTLLAY